MPTENTMASAIITSAKYGAYLAIGLYVVMVLVVSLSAQSQQSLQAPIQVAYPAIQFEHRAQSVMVDHADVAGVVGA
jgi:sensor domain CHASE-containing protein